MESINQFLLSLLWLWLGFLRIRGPSHLISYVACSCVTGHRLWNLIGPSLTFQVIQLTWWIIQSILTGFTLISLIIALLQTLISNTCWLPDSIFNIVRDVRWCIGHAPVSCQHGSLVALCIGILKIRFWWPSQLILELHWLLLVLISMFLYRTNSRVHVSRDSTNWLIDYMLAPAPWSISIVFCQLSIFASILSRIVTRVNLRDESTAVCFSVLRSLSVGNISSTSVLNVI